MFSLKHTPSGTSAILYEVGNEANFQTFPKTSIVWEDEDNVYIRATPNNAIQSYFSKADFVGAIYDEVEKEIPSLANVGLFVMSFFGQDGVNGLQYFAATSQNSPTPPFTVALPSSAQSLIIGLNANAGNMVGEIVVTDAYTGREVAAFSTESTTASTAVNIAEIGCTAVTLTFSAAQPVPHAFKLIAI